MSSQQILVINLDEFLLQLPMIKNKVWQDIAQIQGLEVTQTFLMATYDANIDKQERLMREYPKLAPYFETVQKRFEGIVQSKLDDFVPCLAHVETLASLNAKIDIALCSNLKRDDLNRMTWIHNLPFKLVGLYSTREVLAGKPDADIYLKIARQQQVHPSKLITVDATLNGVQAGYLANTKALFVAEFYAVNEAIQEYSTAYLSNFDELKTTLETWLINRSE